MIDYLGYNLTQYKEFRQLQLQYLKTVSLNQSLQAKIESIQQAYEQKSKELMEMRKEEMEEKLKLKNRNLKYKKLYKQLLQHIESSLASFKGKSSPKHIENRKNPTQQDNSLSHSQINTSQNDKSLFIYIQQAQTVQRVCKKLTQMTNTFLNTKKANSQLEKRLQQFTSQQNTQYQEKEKTEMMIIRQIQNLENQLEELNQVNIQLEAKLNINEKEKRKLQVEVRHGKQQIGQMEQRISQLMKEKQHQTQQDSEFALDFMTYQLHTLQSMFTRLSTNTKCSSQLSNLMSILYSDYEQLSEIFREKLQIEYDLEELQQRYKTQKSSSEADQSLLIETRRQIQTFRLELLKQKEVFRQKEQYVEEHFEEYIKINEQEMKIKNYSYQLENRLYKQKRSGVQTSEHFATTRSPTAREILLKRTINIQKNQNFESKTTTNNNRQPYSNQDFLKGDLQQETVDNKEQLSAIPSKKNSLRFKQTNNAEEIINEIIKKDKANMEKILKETRKTAIPFYMGKRQ